MPLIDPALLDVLNMMNWEIFLRHAYILRHLFSILEILHFLLLYLTAYLTLISGHLLAHVVFLVVGDIRSVSCSQVEIGLLEILGVSAYSCFVGVLSQQLCVKRSST